MGDQIKKTSRFFVVIDTNIIIACLKAEPDAVVALSELKKEGRALLISSVTVAEVLAIPALNEAELNRIRDFLRNFISIPFNDNIAEVAALIRRKYRLEIPDAAIAATALINRDTLITRDRQFKKVSEIAVLEI